MLEGNKQFEAFRDKLNANGVMLRCMWEAHAGIAKREGPPPRGISAAVWRKFPDVACYSLCIVGESSRLGTGPCPGDKLANHTIVVTDYGLEDGFGLWTQAPTNKIA